MPKVVPTIVWWAAVVTIAIISLHGCATDVVKPDEVVSPGDLADIAEAYCKSHPDLPCGHVWDCQNTNFPEANLPSYEVCVLDAHPLEWAETYYGGACTPAASPRFDGHPLCWWCCGAGCTRGCNAYQGCFCPAPPPDPTPDAGVDAGFKPPIESP